MGWFILNQHVMISSIRWWAYLHTNGKVLVKRYFDFQDIVEANESPFVVKAIGPFDAIDVNDAQVKANEALLNL